MFQESRAQHRLPNTDYAAKRPYFITVITHERRTLLAVRDGDTLLMTGAGQIVLATWTDLPNRFPTVQLDAFVIMPDHCHGILWLHPKPGEANPSLSEIVRQFKAVITHTARRGPDPGFGWQRNFYDRILRDATELATFQNYILNNPAELLRRLDAGEFGHAPPRQQPANYL